MRFSQEEKYEIIRMVEGSDLGANRILKELGIHKRTYYNWHQRYLDGGFDALASRTKGREQVWNRIQPHEQAMVVDQALEHTELSCRDILRNSILMNI